MNPVKASQASVAILTDASATDLQTAINAFLESLTAEQVLLDMQFTSDGSVFSCLIVYMN